MSQLLTRPPPAAPPPFLLADSLVSAGAVLSFAGQPVRRHLVGHLAWLGARRLFWFTAHGDTEADGQVLEFDELHCVADKWICFYREAKLVACLAGIRSAGLEDPDDYLIAWQLWQEVAPRRVKLIGTCLARFGDAGLDGIDGADSPGADSRQVPRDESIQRR